MNKNQNRKKKRQKEEKTQKRRMRRNESKTFQRNRIKVHRQKRLRDQSKHSIPGGKRTRQTSSPPVTRRVPPSGPESQTSVFTAMRPARPRSATVSESRTGVTGRTTSAPNSAGHETAPHVSENMIVLWKKKKGQIRSRSSI